MAALQMAPAESQQQMLGAKQKLTAKDGQPVVVAEMMSMPLPLTLRQGQSAHL